MRALVGLTAAAYDDVMKREMLVAVIGTRARISRRRRTVKNHAVHPCLLSLNTTEQGMFC
jgi:hypothetical protein